MNHQKNLLNKPISNISKLSMIRSKLKNFKDLAIHNLKLKIQKVKNYINKRPIFRQIFLVIGVLSVSILVYHVFGFQPARAVDKIVKKGQKKKSTPSQRGAKSRAELAKKGGIKVLKNGNQVIRPEYLPDHVNRVYGTKKLTIHRNNLWASVMAKSLISRSANALAFTAIVGVTAYVSLEFYKAYIKNK